MDRIGNSTHIALEVAPRNEAYESSLEFSAPKPRERTAATLPGLEGHDEES
jgi:hypothetical protein